MTVRTQACSQAQAKTRLAAAEKFLEVARLVEEETDPAFSGVTTSLAVHAGIAASDAACYRVLGYRAHGESHYDAVQVLAEIEGAGQVAESLRRVISLKDGAQYGLHFISQENQKVAMRQAERLVKYAREAMSH